MSSFDPKLASTPPAPAGAAAYTDLKGLGALKARAGNDPAALKAASQQFEALFLEMMLKSMRDASLGDGIMDSDEGKLYQDMFDKQIAVSMSAKGSIGIANMMMKQLAPPAPAAGTTAANGALAPAQMIPVIAAQAAAHNGDRPSIGALLAAIRTALGSGFGLSMPDTTGAAADPAAPAAAATAPSGAASSPADFVAKFLPLARRAAATLNVSPLGILAQAALETGWGQKIAKLADGSSAFNLFGIKAGSAWQGKKVGADTLEFSDGVATRRRESFRAYDSAEGSVDDYVQLLKTPRYGQALAAGPNPHAFAAGLAQGGYATDPDYAKKISEILDGDTLRQALGALKD